MGINQSKLITCGHSFVPKLKMQLSALLLSFYVPIWQMYSDLLYLLIRIFTILKSQRHRRGFNGFRWEALSMDLRAMISNAVTHLRVEQKVNTWQQIPHSQG